MKIKKNQILRGLGPNFFYQGILGQIMKFWVSGAPNLFHFSMYKYSSKRRLLFTTITTKQDHL